VAGRDLGKLKRTAEQDRTAQQPPIKRKHTASLVNKEGPAPASNKMATLLATQQGSDLEVRREKKPPINDTDKPTQSTGKRIHSATEKPTLLKKNQKDIRSFLQAIKEKLLPQHCGAREEEAFDHTHKRLRHLTGTAMACKRQLENLASLIPDMGLHKKPHRQSNQTFRHGVTGPNAASNDQGTPQKDGMSSEKGGESAPSKKFPNVTEAESANHPNYLQEEGSTPRKIATGRCN
jgi:hypothetical protein